MIPCCIDERERRTLAITRSMPNKNIKNKKDEIGNNNKKRKELHILTGDKPPPYV